MAAARRPRAAKGALRLVPPGEGPPLGGDDGGDAPEAPARAPTLPGWAAPIDGWQVGVGLPTGKSSMLPAKGPAELDALFAAQRRRGAQPYGAYVTREVRKAGRWYAVAFFYSVG